MMTDAMPQNKQFQMTLTSKRCRSPLQEKKNKGWEGEARV